MGSLLLTKPLCLISLTLVLLTSCGFLPSCKTAQDYTSLVYKGCANQTFSDPTGVYSQTLAALFDSLTAQASKSSFFKTTAGSGQASISGRFQCRGDLNNGDCYNCVRKIPELSDKLCGKTIAGRIQLNGCYGMYEVAGFPQVSGIKMLYQSCKGSQAAGTGFQERRDTAFDAVERGIGADGSKGFYATSYQSMYALGQCEGELSPGDCVDCVKAAVQNAEVECGGSISGQIYLHKCYITYTYYPNGVPKGGGGGGGGGSSSSPSSGSIGQNPGKTIAIVVGGTAAVGFGIILLLFLRSTLKKHDDY